MGVAPCGPVPRRLFGAGKEREPCIVGEPVSTLFMPNTVGAQERLCPFPSQAPVVLPAN